MRYRAGLSCTSMSAAKNSQRSATVQVCMFTITDVHTKLSVVHAFESDLKRIDIKMSWALPTKSHPNSNANWFNPGVASVDPALVLVSRAILNNKNACQCLG